MDVLKLIILLLFIVKVKSSDSPVWCGRPPKCKCYPKIRMVLCKDIKRLPEFDATLMKRTTSITITSREMCKFPEQMLNKSAFISLQNINILKTCIGCDEIGLFRNKRGHIKIISKCKQEETTLNIVTGKPPGETEETGIWTGTTTNFSFWVTQEKSTLESPRTGPLNAWMNAGYILTGLNVIGAIIIITIMIIKCRRQTHRFWPKCLKMETRKTEIERRSIENIGAMSISSLESIELYSKPSSSVKRRSVEREIKPKLF